MTHYNIKKNIKFALSVLIPSIILALITKSLLVGVFIYLFNLELSTTFYFDKPNKMFELFWVNAFLLLAISSLAFVFSETKIITLVILMILTFLSFYAQNFPKYLRALALRFGAVNFFVFSFKITFYKQYMLQLIFFGILGILMFYVIHYYFIPERNFLYTEDCGKIKLMIKAANDRYFENVLEILVHGKNIKSEKFIKKIEMHKRKFFCQVASLDSNNPINPKILQILELHYSSYGSIKILKNVVLEGKTSEWLSQNYVPLLCKYIREYQMFYNAEELNGGTSHIFNEIKELLEIDTNIESSKKLMFALEVLELNRAQIIKLFRIYW